MKRLLLAVILVMVWAHYALADVSNAPAVTVFDDVIHFVGYTLGIVLMALLTAAANKIQQRWHVAVPTAWLDLAHKYIDQGVSFAEEQAHKSADGALSGNDKLNIAMKFFLQFMGDDKKILAMSEAQVQALIEARLNQTLHQPTITATETMKTSQGTVAVSATSAKGSV